MGTKVGLRTYGHIKEFFNTETSFREVFDSRN